jgi:hypothetical protein
MEYVIAEITSNTVTPSVKGKRHFSLITQGIWKGTLVLQCSQEDGSWKDIKVFSTFNNYNVSFSYEFSEEVELRIASRDFTEGACCPEIQFSLI